MFIFPLRYLNFIDLSAVLDWRQILIILIGWYLPYVSATLFSLALPNRYLLHQTHIHAYTGYQYRYYPGLNLLNFYDRTLTGVLIWSSRQPWGGFPLPTSRFEIRNVLRWHPKLESSIDPADKWFASSGEMWIPERERNRLDQDYNPPLPVSLTVTLSVTLPTNLYIGGHMSLHISIKEIRFGILWAVFWHRRNSLT